MRPSRCILLLNKARDIPVNHSRLLAKKTLKLQARDNVDFSSAHAWRAKHLVLEKILPQGKQMLSRNKYIPVLICNVDSQLVLLRGYGQMFHTLYPLTHKYIIDTAN